MIHERMRVLGLPAAAIVLAVVAVLPLALAEAPAPSQAPAAGSTALDTATARAELRYVADTVLAVHPAMTDEASRAAFLRSLATESAALGDAPHPDDVAMAAQRLLATLGDAHTTAAPQAAADDFLPVAFFAAQDGILASPVGAYADALPQVGRLLRLGPLTVGDVLARLGELVPGNQAWVRYHGTQMLGAGPVLRWLGAVDGDAVTVVVQAPGGGIRSARVPLVPAAALQGRSAPLQPLLQRAAGLSEPWEHQGDSYRWRIDRASGTGIFWLLSCVDSPAYRQAVDAFFQAVRQAGAQRVVLDLRFDGGGNSAVADVWLRHLPDRAVRTFGVRARISPPVLAQRGITNLAAALLPKVDGLSVLQKVGAVSQVPASEPVFHGSMLVVVNGGTFSSAGMVATLLSDNGLARIVGEPMGADAGGYGDILRFETPVLELPFTVSYKRFTRPFPARGPDLAVDIQLPLTANDVLAGRDALEDWLAELEP